MDTHDALEQLRAARERNNWVGIAEIIEDVRRSGSWQPQFGSPSEWLEAAAQAVGYSTNSLRRMLAARQFLDRVKNERPDLQVIDPAAGSPAFALSIIEILKRMHDVAPAKAMELLAEGDPNALTYRQVKSLYDDLVENNAAAVVGNPPFGVKLPSNRAHVIALDANKLGIRQSQKFARRAFEAINNNLAELSGGGETSAFYRHYKFDYVNPDAVAIGRQGYALKFVDGFEFRPISGSAAPGQINSLLAEVAFASSFFRRYWLVVPRHPGLAARLTKKLNELEILSVGVADLDDETGKLTIASAPKLEPTPNRQELVRAEVFRAGVPDA